MRTNFTQWNGSPLWVGTLSDLAKFGLIVDSMPLSPSGAKNWLLTTIRQGHPFPMLVAQDGVAVGDTAKYLATWLWLWQNYLLYGLKLHELSDYPTVLKEIRLQGLDEDLDTMETLLEWHHWITRKPVTIWEMP